MTIDWRVFDWMALILGATGSFFGILCWVFVMMTLGNLGFFELQGTENLTNLLDSMAVPFVIFPIFGPIVAGFLHPTPVWESVVYGVGSMVLGVCLPLVMVPLLFGLLITLLSGSVAAVGTVAIVVGMVLPFIIPYLVLSGVVGGILGRYLRTVRSNPL